MKACLWGAWWRRAAPECRRWSLAGFFFFHIFWRPDMRFSTVFSLTRVFQLYSPPSSGPGSACYGGGEVRCWACGDYAPRCFSPGTMCVWPHSVLWGCGWWRSEDVGERLLRGCSETARVVEVFYGWQFLCEFFCFVLFVFQLTGCFVVINLVSAFSPDCVTDSQIKQSYMLAQMHHSGWLGFMCSNLSVFAWVLFGSG